MLRLTLALMLCLAGTIVVGFTTNGDDFNNDEIDVDSQEANYLGKAEKTQRLWEQYKKLHGLTFSPSQDRKRLKIFMSTIDEIHEHNLEADMGQHSYRMGLNKFAHLTKQEMDSMNGYIPNPNRRSMTVFRASQTFLPPKFDYRTVGWVTPVKDQGNCGSCYAFAVIGAVEGQVKRKTGQLYQLSEQQIVDCNTIGSHGCNGGGVYGSIMYLKNVTGSASAVTYPYTAKQGPCRFTEAMVVPGSRIKEVLSVHSRSEAALMEALVNNGPIAVCLDASASQGVPRYRSGILSCTSKPKINHCVLLVGYDSENGKDYWIVKNSWGNWWGAKGYINIARNSTEYANCGITRGASIPVMY